MMQLHKLVEQVVMQDVLNFGTYNDDGTVVLDFIFPQHLMLLLE